MTVSEALEIVSKTDPLSVEKWFDQLVESEMTLEAVNRAADVGSIGSILALICIAYEAGRVAEAHERKDLDRSRVLLPGWLEAPDA
jgi:hypothetical protein